MATATIPRTRWHLQGAGYEFCNCDFGCGCNFGGFPNSKDGSCHAFVGMTVKQGACGSVDLSGLKLASLLAWPKAIHEGNGRAVFVVEPSTTGAQIDALSKIFTGQLGGMPWELLGQTFKVTGLVKTRITIEGEGRRSVVRAEGVGEGRGDAFKNPVTGEDHLADVHLPTGFIWKQGQCGRGSFHAAAEGVTMAADGSNWIHYEYDWSNA
ncbi:MAG: hypothetical protein A3D33_05160 [Candidatus Rokubacteria bacterium RIFCSPHIGHO2_02_FULL_73_26]|nr:MAG: hypothetical protein A3D33_05160 [Candidatus Rokubacteria bacterium RIFCSPHIGHO2_02_FULL_73_26]